MNSNENYINREIDNCHISPESVLLGIKFYQLELGEKGEDQDEEKEKESDSDMEFTSNNKLIFYIKVLQ